MTTWIDEVSKNWLEKDAESARNISQHLDMPFHRLDLSELYQEKVFKPTIEAYRQGLTPNPSIM